MATARRLEKTRRERGKERLQQVDVMPIKVPPGRPSKSFQVHGQFQIQYFFLLKGLGDTDCPTTSPRWAGREMVLTHVLVRLRMVSFRVMRVRTGASEHLISVPS
jgi:hypothetical protein